MRFFRLWKYLSELHKTEYTKSFCVFSSYFRTIKDNWIKVFTDSEHSEHLKSLLIKIRIDVSNYNNIDEIKNVYQLDMLKVHKRSKYYKSEINFSIISMVGGGV